MKQKNCSAEKQSGGFTVKNVETGTAESSLIR